MAPELSCAETEELIALAALGALHRREAGPLDQHLRQCATCRDTAVAHRHAAGEMSTALEPVSPPLSVRNSLMRIAYADAQPMPRQRRMWLDGALMRRRVVTIAAGAVTAAAVAVAVVAVVRPSSSLRNYPVVGTTSAPQVRGTLTYDPRQQQAVLTVTGLPQPASPAGAAEVYEVWLVPAGGAPQGVAFLNGSPNGASWSTVIDQDLSRFSTVAATAEPAGGSPEPTGAQLLSVQVTR